MIDIFLFHVLKMIFLCHFHENISKIKLTLDVKLNRAVHACVPLKLTSKDDSVFLFCDGLYTHTASVQAVFFFQIHHGTIAVPLKFHLVWWVDTSISDTSQRDGILNLCLNDASSCWRTWLNSDRWSEYV